MQYTLLPLVYCSGVCSDLSSHVFFCQLGAKWCEVERYYEDDSQPGESVKFWNCTGYEKFFPFKIESNNYMMYHRLYIILLGFCVLSSIFLLSTNSVCDLYGKDMTCD